MAAARAEIGHRQVGQLLQPLDLLPDPGHGAGVEHLQVELAETPQHGARPQFVEDRERRDLPHGGLDPRSVEGQLVLPVMDGQFVFGQPEVLEPRDEFGSQNAPLTAEYVAAQPRDLTLAEAERASVVQLLAQQPGIDLVGDPDAPRAVGDPEGCLNVGVPAQDRLCHQELVEIGIEQRPHDRVDAEAVVVDSLRQIQHALGTRPRASFTQSACRARPRQGDGQPPGPGTRLHRVRLFPPWLQSFPAAIPGRRRRGRTRRGTPEAGNPEPPTAPDFARRAVLDSGPCSAVPE